MHPRAQSTDKASRRIRKNQRWLARFKARLTVSINRAADVGHDELTRKICTHMKNGSGSIYDLEVIQHLFIVVLCRKTGIKQVASGAVLSEIPCLWANSDTEIYFIMMCYRQGLSLNLSQKYLFLPIPAKFRRFIRVTKKYSDKHHHYYCSRILSFYFFLTKCLISYPYELPVEPTLFHDISFLFSFVIS